MENIQSIHTKRVFEIELMKAIDMKEIVKNKMLYLKLQEEFVEYVKTRQMGQKK